MRTERSVADIVVAVVDGVIAVVVALVVVVAVAVAIAVVVTINDHVDDYHNAQVGVNVVGDGDLNGVDDDVNEADGDLNGVDDGDVSAPFLRPARYQP